jgi:hypothetical protein
MECFAGASSIRIFKFDWSNLNGIQMNKNRSKIDHTIAAATLTLVAMCASSNARAEELTLTFARKLAAAGDTPRLILYANGVRGGAMSALISLQANQLVGAHAAPSTAKNDPLYAQFLCIGKIKDDYLVPIALHMNKPDSDLSMSPFSLAVWFGIETLCPIPEDFSINYHARRYSK